MTIRGYIAIFYAVLATGASVFADDLKPAPDAEGHKMLAMQVDWSAAEMLGEFEPIGEGAWERDDLPAYLTEDPADLARARDAAEGLAGDETL